MTRKAVSNDHATRQILLDVAGRMFSDKGYGRVSGKDIAGAAGVNAAAINYHFGSVDALYAAVVGLVKARFLDLERLDAEVARAADGRGMLQVVMGSLVELLIAPAGEQWMGRLAARELIAPTPEGAVMAAGLVRFGNILRKVACGLLGEDVDADIVERLALSLLSTSQWLLVVDRALLKAMFPSVEIDAAHAEILTGHLVTYSFGGATALGETARAASVP